MTHCICIALIVLLRERAEQMQRAKRKGLGEMTNLRSRQLDVHILGHSTRDRQMRFGGLFLVLQPGSNQNHSEKHGQPKCDEDDHEPAHPLNCCVTWVAAENIVVGVQYPDRRCD